MGTSQRLLVEWTRVVSGRARATRAVVLRRLVEEGVSVAEAARRLGISRQMARRILGEADKVTAEGVKDGLDRLHGAAFRSWLGRMDEETRAALVRAAPREQRDDA
jgi:plasmid maintenance system antidote protein VapI